MVGSYVFRLSGLLFAVLLLTISSPEVSAQVLSGALIVSPLGPGFLRDVTDDHILLVVPDAEYEEMDEEDRSYDYGFTTGTGEPIIVEYGDGVYKFGGGHHGGYKPAARNWGYDEEEDRSYSSYRIPYIMPPSLEYGKSRVQIGL